MIVDEQRYLEHYGVLGMKWGVRKERRVTKKHNKKARKLVLEAFKNPEVLISLDQKKVITGAEYIDTLKSGGSINIKKAKIKK